jgi:hypothetical protein
MPHLQPRTVALIGDPSHSSTPQHGCAGWHSSFNLTGVAVKYAFVGHTDRCPSVCSPQLASPNGNAAADAIVK